MHKLKSQAKQNAWYTRETDPKLDFIPFGNPFGKHRPNTRTNTLNTIERGEKRPARRATTDGEGKQSMEDRAGQVLGAGPQTPHAATSPNTMSKVKSSDYGNTVGSIPESQSPRTSLDGPRRPANAEKSGVFDDGKHSDSTTLADGTQARKQTEETGLTQRNGEKSADAPSDGLPQWTSTDDRDADYDNGKNKQGKPNFTFMSQVRATILNSWINVLLIASPVGIATYYAKVNPVAVFVINFIAIIPLAGMLSYATEEIALRTGEVIGGLLNASFGNAVELIVSIIALAQNQVLIVQTSLIGSILSNLLLVMGMCFFFGGMTRIKQEFNMTVAQTASSLLFLAVSSLIIPTAFDYLAQTGSSNTSAADISTTPKPGVVETSRGTAILLLIVYACYLFFQLKTHAEVYQKSGGKNEKRDFGKQKQNMSRMKNRFLRRSSVNPGLESPTKLDGKSQAGSSDQEEEDQPEQPQLHLYVAIGTLLAATVLVALNAEYLVDSINAITCSGGISKNFVGLILLPIVGNAAEHATAVTVAVKDKMDLAIGVAVASAMQIALLVLPFVVVLGWIMGKDDMSLYFDGFQICMVFVAVLLVNYLIQDGESHWLEGVLLMTLYVIIAVAAWFYPTKASQSDCGA